METETEMEKLFHMNSGRGDFSYAQNSSFQKKAQLRARPELEESISKMKIMDCQTYCIVDLGCSVGPNALFPTETIVKAVENKHNSEGIPIPEFQVFFNDLPSSDFNSLFRTLPPMESTDSVPQPTRSYFAAGVSGSFYRRLFPKNMLHFVHSSYSLQWLSQVPDDVRAKNSEAWNRGKVFISKDGPQAVLDAYVLQFRKDFSAFLRARAQEVVVGGLMFLLLLGRVSLDPKEQGPYLFLGELLERALHDLVSQGLIEEEDIDSFNLPFFSPCPEEIRKEVEAEGSFKIERLELLSPLNKAEEVEEKLSKQYSADIRALLEVMLKRHFGEHIMDILFDRFADRVEEKLAERAEYVRKGRHLVGVRERILN